MFKQTQDSILKKPMDRIESIKHVGLGAMFLFGGGMVARALGLSVSSQSGQQAHGYGTSVYGGAKE